MFADVVDVVSSPWMLGLVLLSIALDVFLPVLPSGVLLITATVYAADTGRVSVIALLAGAALVSTLGDHLAFVAAESGSGPIQRLVRRLPRVSKADGHLRVALHEHTARTVLLARFVPAGRSVVAFVAGSDRRLPWQRMAPWSLAAGVAFASFNVGLGYLNALLFDTSWISVAAGTAATFGVGMLLVRTRAAASVA